MKSSGSLRFFRTKVAAAVAKYDRFCRLIQSNEEMQQDIYTEVRKLRAQIFDFRYNDIANTIVQKNRKSFNYRGHRLFYENQPSIIEL